MRRDTRGAVVQTPGRRLRGAWAACLAALLLCAGCASASSKAADGGPASATRYRTTGKMLRRDSHGLRGTLTKVTYFSPLLDRPDYYLIYLPPGYAEAARSGTRFPVLYLLHGDGGGRKHLAIHMFKQGRIGTQYDHLLAAHRIRPFIIVMPEADDGTSVDDMEWANTSRGAFESEVTDLVGNVDSRWATIPDRSSRAIAGLSMGGYGAVNIALRHPQLFATVESWSGYFTQTPAAVYDSASRNALRAASPAAYVRDMRPTLRRFPMRFLLYGGTTDPLISQQAPFAAELRALGAPVRTTAFGGPHNFLLWRKHMSLALGFAGRDMKGLR